MESSVEIFKEILCEDNAILWISIICLCVSVTKVVFH